MPPSPPNYKPPIWTNPRLAGQTYSLITIPMTARKNIAGLWFGAMLPRWAATTPLFQLRRNRAKDATPEDIMATRACTAPAIPPGSAPGDTMRLPVPTLPKHHLNQNGDLPVPARFIATCYPVAPTCPQPAVMPLTMACQAMRFTLTLEQAALRYRLQLENCWTQTLGPLIIRADLVLAGAATAQNRQAGFDTYALPVCHYVDSFAAGGRIDLSGDLRLPAARLAPFRLGRAEFLVPLMRICAESIGNFRPEFSLPACFAIGLTPISAGGGIQPFHVDSGLGIWRKLAVRRVQIDDLP